MKKCCLTKVVALPGRPTGVPLYFTELLVTWSQLFYSVMVSDLSEHSSYVLILEQLRGLNFWDNNSFFNLMTVYFFILLNLGLGQKYWGIAKKILIAWFILFSLQINWVNRDIEALLPSYCKVKHLFVFATFGKDHV